jgi:hypothetical protein
MGEHRRNPRAIAKANGVVPFRAERKMPDVEFGSDFQTVVEPNARRKLEIEAEIMRCREAGEPVPDKFPLAPDEADVVVYKTIGVLRRRTPGGLELPGGQAALTQIRTAEFDRMPLAEVMAREREKLAEMLGPQKSLIET